MTLIVARKEGPGTYLVGDTRLTDALGGKSSPTRGAIKLIRINPGVAIGFAGNVQACEAIIEQLFADRDRPYQYLVELLCSAASSALDTEFVIASSEPTEPLVQIKGGVRSSGQNCWIGSKPAYERFQAYYFGELPPDGPPDQQLAFYAIKAPQDGVDSQAFCQMKQALTSVARDGLYGVGDFCVTLASGKAGFWYIPYIDSVSYRISISEGVPHPLLIQSADQGGTSFSFCGSDDDPALAAFYFFQGELGIVFHPHGGVIPRPRAICNVDPMEFADRVWDDYGARAYAGFVTASPRGPVQSLYAEGKVRQAIAKLLLLQRKGGPTDALSYDLGLCHARLGERAMAIKTLSTAITLNAAHAGAFYKRGRLRVESGDWAAAFNDLDNAINLGNTTGVAYYLRALCSKAMASSGWSDDMAAALKKDPFIEHIAKRLIHDSDQ
jgi:tetratricopeptide (TPR) repeat protein